MSLTFANLPPFLGRKIKSLFTHLELNNDLFSFYLLLLILNYGKPSFMAKDTFFFSQVTDTKFLFKTYALKFKRKFIKNE